MFEKKENILTKYIYIGKNKNFENIFKIRIFFQKFLIFVQNISNEYFSKTIFF